jgi:lipopolysaccharide export system permease protein
MPFILSLFVFTLIMLLGNLVRLADLIINRGVNIVLVGRLFIYFIPFLLSYTVPLATICSILLCFGRLSSDNEIIAIRANGVSMARIIAPILILGIILSLASIILNDRVIPRSHFASKKIMTEIGLKNPGAGLEAGTFIESFPGYIIFVYRIEGNNMKHVRIYQPKEGQATRTIVAKRGEFISFPEKRMVKLKLMDGTSDEPKLNDPKTFYKLNFKTYFMNLYMDKDAGNVEKKPKHMSINELEQEMARLKREGIEDIMPLVTEKYKKIAFSFAPLVFVLLGVPLGIVTKRRERSIGFGMAFIVLTVYFLIFIGSESLSLQGVVNPKYAMWASDVILGLAGIILSIRLCVS